MARSADLLKGLPTGIGALNFVGLITAFG